MKNKLRNVLLYIVKTYPYPNDLTKTRITKLVYLVDWENIKHNNKQLTEIDWFYDHYGPYVSDVLDEADEDENLSIKQSVSNFGTIKYLVMPKKSKDSLIIKDLSEDELSIIDKVIKDTMNLSWNQFIDYVYSTPPIKNSNQYSKLDLKAFINN